MQVAVDSPFPGWEPFVAKLVHPLQVAIVEAFLCIGEPLSAVQLGRVLGSASEGFREPNVRYHLNRLAEVGVFEVTDAVSSHGGATREMFFYFAGQTKAGEHSSEPPRPPNI